MQNVPQTWPSRTISVRIGRSLSEAYEFLATPESFGKWASGLGQSLERREGVWIAQTPEGPVEIKFTPRNGLRVLLEAPRGLDRYFAFGSS